ncbi:methylated-DNA--[protein]-cysteine S-methyltransferase [Jannaschia seohaensis]|uniref:Methylated-DNA--protein-cysteine methyltransferase n=1 Tax=Jannaschia seohaensis TaxID=475081 RepID=A0A2Y9A8P4_9RHOB|nr:methylated-DNA--[protein]-cysteine S-methyltransferase [Jannaschia seohaensis]PWJ22289.1 methylated-DNA-[protein]-cysteine S-methyltransferase [Jannaschia seohaensis]SSA38567.1 methylated-DNA-[protein]-cysteine S-methyltransferase [Jannaschia seohaensis]
MTRVVSVASPLGPLLLAGEAALTHLRFPGDAPDPTWRSDSDAFPEARAQLRAYFAGDLTRFDLPLAPEGTPFQRRVWAALQAIPMGETATYKDIATAIGQPGATRAVGRANGANPLPILIPCHRVVAADRLGGFSGPPEIKRALLELEGAQRQPRLL